MRQNMETFVALSSEFETHFREQLRLLWRNHACADGWEGAQTVRYIDAIIDHVFDWSPQRRAMLHIAHG